MNQCEYLVKLTRKRSWRISSWCKQNLRSSGLETCTCFEISIFWFSLSRPITWSFPAVRCASEIGQYYYYSGVSHWFVNKEGIQYLDKQLYHIRLNLGIKPINIRFWAFNSRLYFFLILQLWTIVPHTFDSIWG